MGLYRISRDGKSKCDSCPLRDRNRVRGVADFDKPKIVIVGEAPGYEEDQSGFPFVGKAGKFFIRAASIAGLKWNNIYRMNVLGCRPPNNKIDSEEAIEAMEKCRGGFVHEVKELSKTARCFILAGNTAMNSFGIEGSITKNRGSVYTCKIQDKLKEIIVSEVGGDHDLVSVPTFHPSFIMRGQWQEEVTWVNDLEKAYEISKTKYKPPKEKFNTHPTMDDIKVFCERVVGGGELIGVDIETSGLDPRRSKIVVVGLAVSDEEAISIPFYRKGGRRYWETIDEELKVTSYVNKVLSECPTIYQNALFDVAHLRAHGFNVGTPKHDIMLLHHCLAEDTIIDTLDFGKVPIKDLEGKKDFWVVSHNGNKLVPAKVSKVWKTSEYRDDMVRVVFWSKSRGNKSNMWIDCSSDHRIPTQNRGWVNAEDLKAGDRLIRGQQNLHIIDNKRIHRWVWEQVNNKSLGDLQIHHIDGNHWNNNPTNLQTVTVSEHNKYHLSSQYKATIKMVRKAKERLNKEFDADEVYNLYFNVGLSGREVAKEVGAQYDRVISLFKSKGWKMRSRSEATKLRWEKDNNCRVISVVPLNRKVPVYDMTVNNTHTYSANGIIVSNSIHPELKHNLGYIVSVYGKTPYWKDIVLRSEETIMNADDTELRTYNLRDCVVLHQVLGPMLEHLKKVETEHVYFDISMKLIEPILEMQNNGILIDEKGLGRFRRGLEKKDKELLEAIYDIDGISKDFNLDSGEDLRWLFYGIAPNKYDKAKDELLSYEGPESRKKKDTKKYQALEKTISAIGGTTPLYRTSNKVGTSDAGNLQTNEENRLNIRVSANNRLKQIEELKDPSKKVDEVKEIERLLKFLELFEQYNKNKKLLSTYTSYNVDENSRVHTNYLIHGTHTGRLSSRDPNLQNVPKEAKKVFVSREGWSLVELDYSNLELRVLAVESDDDVLKEIFNDGRNVHSENCKVMFGIDEGHALWDVARRAAKIYIFGRNYGGGLRGIFERVVKEVPELRLTYNRFVGIDREYRKHHPRYTRWVNGITERVKATRKLTNGVGRVRFFLGTPSAIVREGLNFPIQSLAADIMNRSLIETHRYLEFKNYAKLIGTVHDSILLEVKDANLKNVIKNVKQIMESPITIREEECKFPADVAVGKSWSDLKEIKT